MKTKKTLGIAAAAGILALVAGCGSQPVSEGSAVASMPASKPEADRIVAKVGVDGALAGRILNARTLFTDPSVEAIVQGVVTKVRYIYADQSIPMTGLTVAVERSRGDVGAEITSWEVGGLIPVSDLPAVQRDKLFEGKDVPEDALIDYAPGLGAARAAVGDRVVLFVARTNAGPTAGDYGSINDTLGRFGLNKDGSYERAGLLGADQGEHLVLDPATLSAALRDQK